MENFDVTLFAFKIFFIVLNIVMNGSIAFVITSVIKCRNYSIILLLSLTISSIMIGFVSLSFLTILTTLKFWPFGKVLCKIWLIMDCSSNTSSLFALVSLTLHRYLMITRPFSTTDMFSKRRVVYVLLIWFVPTSFWSLMIGLSRYTYASHECFIERSFVVIFFNNIVSFVIPITVTLIVNFLTLVQIKKKTNFKKQTLNCHNPNKIQPFRTPSVATISNCYAAPSSPTAYVPSYSSKTTELGQFYKDNKAVLYIFAKTTTLLVCWMLFLVAWPVKTFCDKCISNRLYEIANWLTYLGSTLDPIIIFIFDDRIKTNLKNFFQNLFCKKTNSK